MKRIIPAATIAILVAGTAIAGSDLAPQVNPDEIISTMNGGGIDHAVPIALFLLGLLTLIGGVAVG